MIYLARKQTSKGWFSLVSQSESESESELQEHIISLTESESIFQFSSLLRPFDPLKTRLLKLEVDVEEPTNIKQLDQIAHDAKANGLLTRGP